MVRKYEQLYLQKWNTFARQNGRLNMYNLGVHLREVYGEFLGNIYTVETMKMQTAEYPLSMMSGQLVNAGLWPPVENQQWNIDMNWQPIPTGQHRISCKKKKFINK